MSRGITHWRPDIERARKQLDALPDPAEWVTTPDGEQFRAGECQGHSACPVERHEHGCYADDGTNCDHPEEHPRPEEWELAPPGAGQ